MMMWTFDDGGRADAGYTGTAGDCVTRAIAIATGHPYQEVYDRLNQIAKSERPPKRGRPSNARTGVLKRTYRKLLVEWGWVWTPTMFIGSGTTVHLRADELPMGRLIVEVSKHVTAVLNGVVFDTHDPSRDGTRCVYGYWSQP
jgi:hypothetical protein